LSRFAAPLSLIIALLCAAPASAGVVPNSYHGQTKLGTYEQSVTASGSCSTSDGYSDDIVLRCGSSNGSVRVRYLFNLSRQTGSITAQVNFFGSHTGAVVATKRVSDSQFRVDVTLDSAGRADIGSVMIEYYSH
jgi:hypothetical protein